MAAEIVPFEKFAVAEIETGDLLETLRDNVGEQTLNEGSLDRVGMPSGGATKWTVPTLEGEQTLDEIVGVIVHTKLVRAYWQTSYDDGGGNDLPDCSSADSRQAFPPNADFTPPAPAHPAGGFACAGCEFAKFGSSEKGQGQACQQRRLVFVLTEGDLLPFVVSLSPKSLKPAGDYLTRLTRGGASYWKVVTSMGLVRQENPKPHAIASFKVAQRLHADAIARVREYRDAIAPAFERVQFVDDAGGSVNGDDPDTSPID